MPDEQLQVHTISHAHFTHGSGSLVCRVAQQSTGLCRLLRCLTACICWLQGNLQHLILQPLLHGSQHFPSQHALVETAQGEQTAANELCITLRKDQGQQQTALKADDSAQFKICLTIDAPLGQYPEGSKVLSGEDRTYVISPLGNIVDERYTSYFEFVTPKTG